MNVRFLNTRCKEEGKYESCLFFAPVTFRSDEAQRGFSGLRDDQSGFSLASGNTRSTATVT